MKSNSIKKSLKTSGMALLLCVLMLIGTTFAWFTDSITNSGNKIQAGSLDIGAMAYDIDAEGDKAVTISGVNGGELFKFEKVGQDLEAENAPAIISETLWEPGISNAKLLQVTNKGTLTAKIKLSFDVKDEGLQDALWFDFVQVKNGIAEGTFIKREMSTLKTFSESVELPLAPNNSIQFVLIYGMKEEAGNAYMGTSFNADVSILAKQNTVENDGFGNNKYDENAKYELVEVTTYEEIEEAIKNASDGSIIKIVDDVKAASPLAIKGGKSVEINTEKKLLIESTSATASVIKVYSGNAVTLTGRGMIENLKSSYGSVVTSFGDTIIDEVLITNEGSNSNMGAILVGEGGSVTIKGGAIKSDKVALKNSGGKVYISGGDFSSKTNDNYNGIIFNGGTGVMEITGGTFNGNVIATSGVGQESIIYIKGGDFKNGKMYLHNGGKIEISGGTFEGYTETNIKPYLAPGYKLENVADNTIKVVKQ